MSMRRISSIVHGFYQKFSLKLINHIKRHFLIFNTICTSHRIKSTKYSHALREVSQCHERELRLLLEGNLTVTRDRFLRNNLGRIY